MTWKLSPSFHRSAFHWQPSIFSNGLEAVFADYGKSKARNKIESQRITVMMLNSRRACNLPAQPCALMAALNTARTNAPTSGSLEPREPATFSTRMPCIAINSRKRRLACS